VLRAAEGNPRHLDSETRRAVTWTVTRRHSSLCPRVMRTTVHGMSSYLLVHGAWCGGWVWDDLTQQLEKAGHRVTVVDQLPSAGTDPAA
jgi:pimeloyl-ACP methyl ester carboxylesterase